MDCISLPVSEAIGSYISSTSLRFAKAYSSLLLAYSEKGKKSQNEKRELIS